MWAVALTPALAEVRCFGDDVLDLVGAELGRNLKRQVVNEYWVKGVVRENAWVKWKTPTSHWSPRSRGFSRC